MEICEIEESERLERFELAYHADGLGVVLPDGTEKIVTGVIDSDLIQRYNTVL